MSYWKKIEAAKAKGLSAEEFESIEGLEAAITYHQNKIDEYEREIKSIEDKGKSRKDRNTVEGVRSLSMVF